MGQPAARGRWVLLYLNGEFRGLYNLLETAPPRFGDDSGWEVVEQQPVRAGAGEWLSRAVAVAGSGNAWTALQNRVNRTDFSNPRAIAELESAVDVESLFAYAFLQAYVQNIGDPGFNWIAYRHSNPDAAGWQVTVGDTVYSFGSARGGFKTNLDTLSRFYTPTGDLSRLLAKPLHDNCEFNHRFVGRARDYLGVNNASGTAPLSKERVKAAILEQAAIVRPFVPLEAGRWNPEMSLEAFDRGIQNALTFVDRREGVVLNQLDMLAGAECTAPAGN